MASTSLFIFHNIFSSLARSKYLSLFSFSLIFTLWSVETAKSTIQQDPSLFFFVVFVVVVDNHLVWSSVRDHVICLYLKTAGKWLYLILPNGDSGCTLNLNFLHNSLWITFPTQGCPRGVMVKAMNCGIVVREFVLQSRYYVHFRANTLGKGMNPLILPPAMGK